MKIGILGTGVVGRTLAAGFAGLGHEVMMGTRDVATLKGRGAPSPRGGESFDQWHQKNREVKLGGENGRRVRPDRVKRGVAHIEEPGVA